MKTIYFFCILLFLASCSGLSKYEQTIADYVQTDRKGTKYDLKFKVLELKELKKVSVGDSITYLEQKWEEEKTKKLKSHNENLERAQKSLEKEKTNRFSTKTMIDLYTKSINRGQHAIDSLTRWRPDWISKYDTKKKDEILAILVECKYKAIVPMTTTEFEETREFTLSPDGLKCYRQSAPKKQ